MAGVDKTTQTRTPPRRGSVLFRIFLKTFIPSSLLLSGIFYAFTHLTSQYELQNILIREASTLKSASEVTSLILEQKLSDLMVLAEGETLRNYLHDDSMKNWVHLTREFSLFARRKPQYVQIRFLDEKGIERVRINNKHSVQSIVPKKDLQDKSNRYYFKKAFDLNEGDIYASPLDLNIENGDIVIPFEPTIRFATPIFDGYGDKRGIVIFNYDPKELLIRLSDLFSAMSGEVVMLNPEGYWLMGLPEERLWGFMFNSVNTYADEHPDVWGEINLNNYGSYRSDQGIFVYRKSFLFNPQKLGTLENLPANEAGDTPHTGDPYWILVSRISKTLITQLSTSRTLVTTATYLSLFLLSGIISYFFSKTAAQKQLAYQRLEERAVTDALTGVSNRRELMIAGEREIQRAIRFERQLCVMMLDLDHFKNVNDNFGHNVGDQVLKHFTTICQSTIREEDMLARYGGEEFVITMPETDTEGAVELADRICSNVQKQPYRHYAHDIPLTVSIGISAFNKSDTDYKQILQRADSALYRAKTRGRNRVETVLHDKEVNPQHNGTVSQSEPA